MTKPDPEFSVVLATASSEAEAAALARALVDRRLAACVSVVPGVRSFYRWQGAVHEDAEHLLVIKTRASHFDALRESVRALHSYDTPEIVMLPMTAGDPDYLAWLASATAPANGSESS